MAKKANQPEGLLTMNAAEELAIERAIGTIKIGADGNASNMRAVVAKLIDEFQLDKDDAEACAGEGLIRLRKRLWPTMHGGARAGAGRKPILGERMVSRTVSLPANLIERLTAMGEGNLSAGIRRLADRDAMHTHKKSS